MKQHLSHTPGPIGVFDSGYGGLTILDTVSYTHLTLPTNSRV